VSPSYSGRLPSAASRKGEHSRRQRRRTYLDGVRRDIANGIGWRPFASTFEPATRRCIDGLHRPASQCVETPEGWVYAE
jgi:hypothetical protein